MGDAVKAQVMRYIDETIIPRVLGAGTVFQTYADQDLQAGGIKAGLLYRAMAEANARALNHRQDVALHFFHDAGWSNEQAAAIVGNLTAESGLDSGRPQENSGPGYGLAQWEKGKARAIEFERVMHSPLVGSSLQQQLQFINYELQVGRQNPMRQAGDQLKLQKGIDDASRIFTTIYERPGSEAQVDKRVDAAKRVYRQFYGK